MKTKSEKKQENPSVRDMFFPIKENDLFIVKVFKNILFYTIGGIMAIMVLIMFSMILIAA
ncbi:hypothetical protein [Neptunitalea lumnitzerae]|uniref:Uncharacterized protein n=1 Tax=Neptunitalea lumnitzerae TaxID=2965509 RepID=A0ABQ5MJ34_9FLAO|nr:hypothetical protein [Neptunitalea sp. Y10]GLB49418.1 hypothetical protein Y10_17860 [Neptunitalea sp. Y10]